MKYNFTPKTIKRLLSDKTLYQKKKLSYFPSFENIQKKKSKVSLVKLEGMALKIKKEMINKGVSSCKNEDEFNCLKKFKCSHGYLQKFYKEIVETKENPSPCMVREAVVTKEYLEQESIKKKLEELSVECSKYPLQNISNMDKTGLLYKNCLIEHILQPLKIKKTPRVWMISQKIG